MPVGEWTIFHVSQSNPEGPGQGSVPVLLEVQDVAFSSCVGVDGEDDLTVTVYYHRSD